MSQDELRARISQALVDSIAEAQKQSGREIQPMTEETIPLLDLIGFDSHNGVEVEIYLSIRLGIEIENLPFRVGKRGSKELKVREIVNVLLKRHEKELSGGKDKEGVMLVTH